MEFIPGLLKGFTRVIIGYPFDVAKLHIQKDKSASLIDFCKSKKVSSMYKGVYIQLISLPLKRSIQFTLFERFNKKNLNSLLSGMLSGAGASVINIPYYYVNNNYVINNYSLTKKKDTIQIPRDFKSLYSGYKPEFIRSCFSSSLALGTYGYLRNTYGNSNSQTVINSILSGVVTWTIIYPFDTLRVEQQTKEISSKNTILYEKNSLISIIKSKYNKNEFFKLWKGISCVYIRIIPTSIISMTVYEMSKHYLEGLSPSSVFITTYN